MSKESKERRINVPRMALGCKACNEDAVKTGVELRDSAKSEVCTVLRIWVSRRVLAEFGQGRD